MCMSPSTDTTSRLGRDMGVTYLSVTYLGERNPNYLEQVAAPNWHQPIETYGILG